jgi:hypothetical protein
MPPADGQWVPNKTFDTALAGTKIAVDFWQDTPGSNHVRYDPMHDGSASECTHPTDIVMR